MDHSRSFERNEILDDGDQNVEDFRVTSDRA
jgi:hypothetical protein